MGTWSLALGLVGLRLFGFFTEPLLSSRDIHAVVGEPHRIVPADDEEIKAPGDLRVITWNIERGTRFRSIVDALRSFEADVILLQEVDRGCDRSGNRDVAKDLAHALGMNWVAAGEFQEIGEGGRGRAALTGQAVLSRFTIDDAQAIRFSAQDKWRWSINPSQPRRGGRIALKTHIAGTTIYNTHIESGTNRSLQRRQIAEILADAARVPTADPVIIGGDFNSGPWASASMFTSLDTARFLDALGDLADRGPTSTGGPHPIDWIFVKELTPAHGRIVKVEHASDHYPVFATLGSSQLLR